MFELKRFELDAAIQLAFEIHSKAESINEIEFIILAYEDEKIKITSIKENSIIRDCKQCYIGSTEAYKFFRNRLSVKSISGAFEETVDGCGDRSVGGFPICVIYDKNEQSFTYAYSRVFSSCKQAKVKLGEAIPFYLSAEDGGFSYETDSIGIEELYLSIDQMDHKVLYSRQRRHSAEDINNKYLTGLMLPMEIYNDNGIWKRC